MRGAVKWVEELKLKLNDPTAKWWEKMTFVLKFLGELRAEFSEELEAEDEGWDFQVRLDELKQVLLGDEPQVKEGSCSPDLKGNFGQPR